MIKNIKNPPGLQKILAQKQAKKSSGKPLIVASTGLTSNRRINSHVLAEFTRQLATLIGARLALTDALTILARQTHSSKLGSVIESVRQQVESGESLAAALKLHKKTFSHLYISLVKVGEVAGVLPSTLNRLATYLERMSQVKRKFVMAMTYPAVIVTVAVGAVTFMMTVIVPIFAEMFRDFGAEMPLATRWVIAAGQFLKSWSLIFLMIFVAGGFLLKNLTSSGQGKYFKDRLIFKLPLINTFVKNSLIGRFCRTLGTLLESGVSLLEALDVAVGISENLIFRDEVMEMKNHAIRGGLIADRLTTSTIFPMMVVQMIHVGEETAELDTMLHKIADYYDDALNTAIDTLASVIEPIIIVVLGVVLGGIIIAMYLQLFNLMQAF